MEIATVVVLLDQNSVLGDGRHGDSIVGNAIDGSGCASLSLDPDGCCDRVSMDSKRN